MQPSQLKAQGSKYTIADNQGSIREGGFDIQATLYTKHMCQTKLFLMTSSSFFCMDVNEDVCKL